MKGIEEVTITNPSYSSIPSDAWGADVKLKFFDGTSKEHVLAFDINSNKIRIGVYNKDDEEFQHFLTLFETEEYNIKLLLLFYSLQDYDLEKH